MSGISFTQITQSVAQKLTSTTLPLQAGGGDFLALERDEGHLRRGGAPA